MGDNSAASADALEHIAYLSRSENRVRILETLAMGPHMRRELQETTGVSRTTLGRILTEFENWTGPSGPPTASTRRPRGANT